MTTWEYCVHEQSFCSEADVTRLRQELGRLGSEGWELVQLQRLNLSCVYILKRPRPAPDGGA